MRTLAVVVFAIVAGAVCVASVMWVLGCGYVGLGEMGEDRHMAAAAAAFNLGRGGAVSLDRNRAWAGAPHGPATAIDAGGLPAAFEGFRSPARQP